MAKTIKFKYRPLTGNNRSHALNATRRNWKFNVQTKVFTIDGEKVKVKGSVKDLRSIAKVLAK